MVTDERVRESLPSAPLYDRVAQASRPLRVLVADDHASYREGLAGYLRAGGIEIAGGAPNGAAAVHLAEATAPDVIVMDREMPGMSGIEATREVARRLRHTHVLMVSVTAHEEDVVAAMMAGALGYVLKDEPVDQLLAAIERVAAGECFLSPRVAGALGDAPNGAGPPRN